MTTKLDYEWHLRKVMADRGLFSTTDLRPRLLERGIELSPSQVYRLVTDKPERLNMKVLVALLDILGCQMTELIEPVAARNVRQKRKANAAGAGQGPSDLTGIRPKRARIVPDASS